MVGETYEECRRHGGQELAGPHDIAADTAAWHAVVIQNFQGWLGGAQGDPYRCVVGRQRERIRSWLAVPMQVDGRIRALMVPHSPHSCYFTAFRVRLMEQAAKRLLPLLASAHREIRARSAFTAAVMHEVKNDSHTALLLLNQIQGQVGQPPWAETLVEVRHYLEGLNALGQDALDIFQLGRPERIQDRKETDRDLPFAIGELVDGITLGWRTLYEDTRLEIGLPPSLQSRRIKVVRALAFRRVVRVLMHNAFRHGRDWVRISVGLQSQGNGDRDATLILTVTNPTFDQMASNLAEHLNLAVGRLGSSPLARARLGLAVARQLTTEAGGVLGEFEITSMDGEEGRVQVRISLSWPTQIIQDGPVSKT